MFSFINISIDPNAARAAVFTASWDTFLVLIFVFAVFVYSFFVSRERLALVLLSIYTALAVVLSTPVLSNALMTFPLEQMHTYRLGIFIGLFVILYLLFSYNMSLRSEIGHAWWQSAVLSFMQVGLLMSTILILLPSSMLKSTVAATFFTSDIPRSFWLVAPIASMLIMRPRRHALPSPQQPY